MWHLCVCMKLSRFSRVQRFAALWAVAHQVPLSMKFSWQEYWIGLPCPPPGDLPDPGIRPAFPASPILEGGFFTSGAIWETGTSVSLCLTYPSPCLQALRLLIWTCVLSLLTSRYRPLPVILTHGCVPRNVCLPVGCQFLLSSQEEAQFLPLGPAWFQCPGLSCLTLFLQSAFLSPRP